MDAGGPTRVAGRLSLLLDDQSVEGVRHAA